MFCIYFAVTSALSKSDTLPSYTRSMLDGKFEDALRHIERQINIDDDHFDASSVMAFQALSDASLLLGHGEDAEENYRKAQKLLRGSNEKLNVFSCRNTAWQSLALHRYSAALNCFSRITQDASATPQQKLEAILGVAMIHHHLGQQAAADEALMHARVLAEMEPDTRWSMVIELLALDFSTQLSIRCSAGLRDHAFWQSALVNDNLEAQMQTFHTCMTDTQTDMPAPALMVQRIEYLMRLTRLAAGERGASDLMSTHIINSRKWTCTAYANSVRLEIALAALAGGFVELAEQSLNHGSLINMPSRRWNLDYLYCQAKICMQRGYATEAMQFYASYTHDALQCLRNEIQVIKPLDGIVHTTVAIPTDDISARLPAKYRRAYRYIVENFNKNDLSTREIASHICVTERALQMVFKEHLGMSPTAVVRRLRLEAIRTDLLNEENVNDNIIKTANRWGLKSRSSLIRGYRKQFHESPSQTSYR